MSEELFTNRHGHTITAVEEAIHLLPEPEHVLQASQLKVVRQRRKFRLARWQKRALLILVLAVVGIPLALGEYVRASYDGEVAAAKRDVAAIFSWVVGQQASPLNQPVLHDADTRLAAVRDRLCSGGFFDNIASLYPRSKTAYDACNTYRSKVVALDDAVREAGNQLAYLQQLKAVLGGVTKPLDDQFAVLTSQQENWQNMVNALGQLSVPVTFQTAHNGLKTAAQTVRDQWIALVQATNAYDSTAFNSAKTKLTAAYADFQKNAAVFTAAVDSEQTLVTNAVLSLK